MIASDNLPAALNRIPAEQLPENRGAEEKDRQERGAFFTRTEVAVFMLDLAGYTTDKDLGSQRFLEPSFGDGSFLLPAIERLLRSWKKFGGGTDLSTLENAISAVEIDQSSFQTTRKKVLQLLQVNGLSQEASLFLVDCWLMHANYLLTPLTAAFDYVVGNPPYVRQELIEDNLLQEYRARYKTIYDRADLYIPFIEKSLTLLNKKGKVCFICSDRWMKNRYGSKLRGFIHDAFHLNLYIDMVGTEAFEEEVTAYPAITVISRDKGKETMIAHRPPIEKSYLNELALRITAPIIDATNGTIKTIEGVVNGDAPWILESSDQLELLKRLETDFPLIEETGCKVGIGVATGADPVYIDDYATLAVENDRKLPLATTSDIKTGVVSWKGKGVINPFAPDGSLVDLDHFPLLKIYFLKNKEALLKRHVASKSPDKWYRTIDRIYPELARRPKLLIPDIKGGAHVVYEEGRLYPHHNLYYITSDSWDLHCLQAVLLSGIARLFVSLYSTKMRGGYLRFQAQYLRRIRLPRWENIPEAIKKELIEAVRRHDKTACEEVVFTMYGLTRAEREAIGGNGQTIWQ